MGAMKKIRDRWEEMSDHDRNEDQGSSFGVYFTSDEMRELLNKKLLRNERSRVGRLREYIEWLENQLQGSSLELEMRRKKLEHHGDL
jgi:hypothetical protein